MSPDSKVTVSDPAKQPFFLLGAAVDPPSPATLVVVGMAVGVAELGKAIGFAIGTVLGVALGRSEERRVGKECSS